MNFFSLKSTTGFAFTVLYLFNEAFMVNGLSPMQSKPPQVDIKDHDVGEPLILTPLINSGKLEEGRKLSRVQNLTAVVSYSGYFTVNPKYNSNMFFWFFPAAFNPETAPVLIWLQGGPGSSSLFGLFTENGPFIINSKMEILFRTTSWSFTHNLIYFDNPVGTGFSYTDSDDGYCRNENQVANDLYSAITQFLTLFPHLVARDFYISGESYAGKYIPAIAYKIHVENQKSPKLRINLKGMAIGDGFTDPVNMLNYGEYLYNVGLIDKKQRAHFQQEEDKTRNFILNGNFSDAFSVMDELIIGILTEHPTYFKNCTGLNKYYNILVERGSTKSRYYAHFVQLPHVRRSLHVGNQSYGDLKHKVVHFLREDMYQSTAPWVAKLLDANESYQVLFYTGQLDIIVAQTLTENFLEKMKWHGALGWSQANRTVWKVESEVAGYIKTVDNLSFLMVRKAGHMVPTDQPKWAFDLINRFTHKKPFSH